jgi:hypothetical protein
MEREREYLNGMPKVFDKETLIIPEAENGIYRWIQQCCDCGLIHILEFTIEDSNINVKVERYDGNLDMLKEIYEIIPTLFKES